VLSPLRLSCLPYQILGKYKLMMGILAVSRVR
jgi:hypothetical protein